MTTLNKLHKNRKKRKQTDTLEVTDIDYLIRKDPITCTRYYRHKINALNKFICHDDTFFGRVLDHYFVTMYIQILQSTLKQPTMFLKLKESHICNNSFTKDIPNMWYANTDAQYVLNAYATTLYYSSYMMKVDKSMTNAFRRIHKEHETS